ncbi:MAG: TM0106 family RecB-like putative nuclease, partial [Candidatus Eremiobacteraeota bacterium]|nr:TM0106 family RecB-like putative nuclease [Candidatus Eremiobacteraeota bacterium]
RGTAIIYQATFFDERFVGRADFLRRIDAPSKLGAWSYEVLDTKLALKPKPYFLIQLCNYGEHVERLQGLMPAHGAIILGDGTEERYRLHDYLAYYRHLKRRFVEFAGAWTRSNAQTPDEYPHRRAHCAICVWNDACTQQREADDHLSLVASMRRDHIAKFGKHGVTTVATLARADDGARPDAMHAQTFEKLRRQARLQVQGRSDGPVYELLPHDPPLGFAWLPAPAAGDVFFDMEGDPLFEPARGLEYLFGCWLPEDQPAYRAFWALDRDAEKAAFEEFVDFIVARRHAYPAMHVYHYGNYEKTALRKLAQVHCTRENEIDDLLRGEVLVDLYTVVRQAIAISEPRYGLKNVEKFYGVTRATGVRKGDESIVMFERWLLSHDETILADIEAYNQDDCRSTALLREWLLERRGQAIEQFGMPLPFRPVRSPREPCHPEFTAGCTKCENQRQREREEGRRSELEQTLLAGVLAPQSEDEYRAMHAEKRTRYLLGNLLAYHRREEKPAYWAYFDRREQVDDFVRDREAIGGLEFQEAAPLEKIKNSSVYTFRFPEQPHKLEAGDTPHDPATEPYKTTGTIVALDSDGNELRLKWTGSREQARAITALMPRHPLPTVVQHEAVGRIAEAFAQGALSRDFPATFGLLMAHEPRVQGIAPGARVQPAMVSTAAVSRLVAGLERSYLFVQGPPGSGK